MRILSVHRELSVLERGPYGEVRLYSIFPFSLTTSFCSFRVNFSSLESTDRTGPN